MISHCGIALCNSDNFASPIGLSLNSSFVNFFNGNKGAKSLILFLYKPNSVRFVSALNGSIFSILLSDKYSFDIPESALTGDKSDI